MPDEVNQQQAPVIPSFDPFKTDAPPAQQQQAPVADPPPVVVTPEPPKQEDFKYVDPNEWVKETFGWESVDAGKKAWEDAQKAKEQFKFENPDSEKVFTALREGKFPELREILNRQHQIEQLEKADPNNPAIAAEIIKTGMQLKNPMLTQQQVDFLFNQNYSKPSKPGKAADEDDADYAGRIAEWEQKAKDADMKLSIDALMMQPDILKMKTDLKFPDIQQPQPAQPAGPTQKELDDQKRYVDAYIKSVDDSLKGFNGFDVTFKDETVEIPVSYVVTDQERTALAQELKNFAQQNFDANAIFADRWVKEDGTLDVLKMAQDKYVLQNLGKILQKVSNESGTKRLEHKLKVDSNITVNGGTSQKTFDPAQKSAVDALAEAVWKS